MEGVGCLGVGVGGWVEGGWGGTGKGVEVEGLVLGLARGSGGVLVCLLSLRRIFGGDGTWLDGV